MSGSSPEQPAQETSVRPSAQILVEGSSVPLDIYSDAGFRALTRLWVMAGWQRKLSYEPTWLGVPIIQLAEDILMMQELLYKVRPGVVVETGVAHGGSAIFYASILELLGHGRVVAVDVEIRKYNRLAILSHPQSDRIKLIEGDSTARETFQLVQASIPAGERVVVTLDSNHARDHVLRELELYSCLVSPGSYIVVFDTVMDLLAEAPSGRPDWRESGAGAAVRSFLQVHPEFQVDPYYGRLGATYCEGGFLRRLDTAVDSGGGKQIG
jgi:cephalosporin hydroxylase